MVEWWVVAKAVQKVGQMVEHWVGWKVDRWVATTADSMAVNWAE